MPSLIGETSSILTKGGKNAFDILCPREGCRCVILEAESSELLSSDASTKVCSCTNSQLPLLPDEIQGAVNDSASESSHNPAHTSFKYDDAGSHSWWCVDSPLAFYNVGFSKDLVGNSSTVKYLICADCDVGPIGFHDTNGVDLRHELELEDAHEPIRKNRKFLVDAFRVRYDDKKIE